MKQETTVQDECIQVCYDADRKIGNATSEMNRLEKVALELLRDLQREELELQHLRRDLLEKSGRLSMQMALEYQSIFADSDEPEDTDASDDEPKEAICGIPDDLSSLTVPELRDIVKGLGGSPYAGAKPKSKRALIEDIEELRDSQMPWDAWEDDEHLFDEEALDYDDLFGSEAESTAPPKRIGVVRISGQRCDVLGLPNGSIVIEQDGEESIPVTPSDLVRLAERGQIRLGNRMVTSWEAHPSGHPFDSDESVDEDDNLSDDTPDWEARGAISSYNDNGTFENCFRLRSMTKARSEAKFRLPPVEKDYRSQLEPRFGQVATMTGTLVGTVRYDNCIRLVLDDMELSRGKGATAPMGHICLFVSRDYKAPATGTRLKVTGFVYAYSPSQTDGKRKQLGVNAITLRELGK